MERETDPREAILLAGLLAAPAEGALEVLREFQEQAPWLDRAINELELMPLDQWQGEHTRLFVTGYPKTVCPPFESAYREGRMDGNAAAELEALYAEMGLGVEEMPADFLGTMLGCAGHLAAEGQAEGPQWRALWQDHLLEWVPDFTRDLRANSGLLLYRLLADRLELLCTETYRELAESEDG